MTWPVYDEPYEAKDSFGSYAEIIVSGADDDARELNEPRAMVVLEDEWNEDFSVRTIRKIAAIGREP